MQQGAMQQAAVAGEVIADRECGSCNVCCVALTIDEPELQKVQGYRCRNARPDNSCAIYPTRPRTCRGFNCGWRLLKWVKLGMRPDRSGVLIRLQRDGAGEYGIVVSLLNRGALKAEGLAETVAAAVSAGVKVHLHIPGPPGHTSAQGRIDGALAGAVASRDKAAVLEILRQARQQGRSGRSVPIRLKHASTAAPLPEPGSAPGGIGSDPSPARVLMVRS